MLAERTERRLYRIRPAVHDLLLAGALLGCAGGAEHGASDGQDAPSLGAGDSPSVDRTIVPRERFGAIQETTSRSELEGIFGKANVQDGWIYLAEGFCVPGTLVFPSDVDELELTWSTDERVAPATVRVRNAGGHWATADGVRIGTTLEELEQLRGGPLEFGGFGWDYGGGTRWNGLSLRLAPDASDYRRFAEEPEFREILGERTVRSDHALIRKMTVRVELIELVWSYPEDEQECPEGAFRGRR